MTDEGVSRRLWALGPPVMPVADRLRLGLPTILVLVGGGLLGYFAEGLLVGLGTYTVLFGGIPRRRRRAVVMAGGGVGLVVAVVLGVLVSDSLGQTVLALAGVGTLAAWVDSRYPLGPPGPYFFLLMAGAGGVVGQAGLALSQVVLPLVVGTVVAFVAAVAGADRGGAAPEATGWTRATTTGAVRVVGSAVLVLGLATAIGSRPGQATAWSRSGMTS